MTNDIEKRVKEASDMQLIAWTQDINRQSGEEIYSEDFRNAVHDEICRRGS